MLNVWTLTQVVTFSVFQKNNTLEMISKQNSIVIKTKRIKQLFFQCIEKKVIFKGVLKIYLVSQKLKCKSLDKKNKILL